MDDSSPVSYVHGVFLGRITGVGCHFLLEIFPSQGSNLSLLHWQADSLALSHQRRLGIGILSEMEQDQYSVLRTVVDNCSELFTSWKRGTVLLFWGLLRRNGLSQSIWRGLNDGEKESESEITQSCLTLCNPMDCSLPGFSVHGIFQARVLEWAAISFSRGSSWPRDQTQVSCLAGRHFILWATREAQMMVVNPKGINLEYSLVGLLVVCYYTY